MANAISTSTTHTLPKPQRKAEIFCLLASIIQAIPPLLLLWLSRTAYAEPRAFSQAWEDLLTSLLLGMSAFLSLGLGGVGLYLLLRRGRWNLLFWLFALLGWVGIFAGVVYTQALLIFWAWI